MAKKYVADLDEGEKIRMVLDTLISIDQLCLRNFLPQQARYLTKKLVFHYTSEPGKHIYCNLLSVALELPCLSGG